MRTGTTTSRSNGAPRTHCCKPSRGEPDLIPKKYIAIAFLGGAVSAGLATLGELGYGGFFTPTVVETVDLTTLIMVALIAPIVEESVKPLGIYLIGRDEKPNLTIMEWAWLGLFAGLGFALLEDALYASMAAGSGGNAMLALTAIRLALPVHMIATTLSGIGVGLYHKTKDPRNFLMMLVLAMAVHGIYNFSVTVIQ